MSTNHPTREELLKLLGQSLQNQPRPDSVAAEGEAAGGGAPGKAVELLGLAMTHARDLFSTSANQRMQLVNFFVLAAAFTAQAYERAVTDGLGGLATVLALFGLLVSVLFLGLELRAEALNDLASDALGQLEDVVADLLPEVVVEGALQQNGIVPRPRKSSTPFRIRSRAVASSGGLIQYRYILRTLYGGAALVSVLGACQARGLADAKADAAVQVPINLKIVDPGPVPVSIKVLQPDPVSIDVTVQPIPIIVEVVKPTPVGGSHPDGPK